ncbi:hypothetical protein ACQKIE_10485 [Luteibacter sp. NPDC031894]|uniref:hypothetical protein n=1 Tax=Luteibacter sp. NPDC031894 TaxID=3390572 RepID=UPI003CFD46CC
MMRVSTFPIEKRWLRDYAPSEADALPDANITLPECRVDPSATIDGWIRGVRDVEDAFVRLASPFQLALQRLERERPHVMEQSFDLVSQGGRLRVVDTDLDQADRDWIETELNRDGGLPGWLTHSTVKSFAPMKPTMERATKTAISWRARASWRMGALPSTMRDCMSPSTSQ